MVTSRVYPGLERKPGGPDNWVEAAGGLPSYIERIAKHLHYEQGFTISHAIASAVNTVKRWARGGTVTAYGTTKRITPKTQALAAKAVTEWNAKRAAGDLRLSETLLKAIDLAEVIDLAKEKSHLKPQKCKFCSKPATKSILWAEGNAYIPTCDAHLSKGKAAVTDPFTHKTDPDGINAIYDLGTKRRIDLADADIKSTSTMVALMIPQAAASKVAVQGGVPADDLHVTLLFAGDLDDDAFKSLTDTIREYAEGWSRGPLKGEIGGIGTFPASGDEGRPWWVPVDVPGINTLHEQINQMSDANASEHGFTPHMTLTYLPEGEPGPDPVEATPVEFSSVWVVRGNDERVEIPLGGQTSAGAARYATLSAGKVDLSRGGVNIEALVERANRIEDPVERAAARAQVLDLASSIAPRNAKGKASDGRPSFARQGKWGHGFVPLDRAAKEAKAKGSPIAIQRLQRLFGGAKAKKPKSNAFREQDAKRIKVKDRTAGETVNDISQLRQTEFQDKVETKHSAPRSRMEASKEPRADRRASQPWTDIPENLKTVRNGKRYVLVKFGDQMKITEWTGGVNEVEQTELAKRKQMSSITAADAANMSPTELRKMLKNPNTPRSVRKVLQKALTAAENKEHSRA